MKMLLVSVILVLVTQHASGVVDIEGIEGESVVLPCEVPPAVTGESVEWSRYDLFPSTVHLRQIISNNPETDVLIDQNPFYRTRTELQTDALKTGDVSLTLRNLRLKDRGTYSCIVRWGFGESEQTQVYLKIISKREVEQQQQLQEQQKRIRDTVIGVSVGFVVVLILISLVVGLYLFLYHHGCINFNRKGLTVVTSAGLTVLTAAGVAVLLYGLTVSADSSLPVLRLFCHLVVVCPYCVCTALMASICCCRKTGNKEVVSMEMTQRDGGGHGLDEEYVDVAADVTTEYKF